MLSNFLSWARLPGICASALVASAALIAGCASAPESVEISDVEEIAATVTAIDQARRLVTLRGPRGNELTMEAGPEVQNLAQVQVGDVVTMSYEQTYIATRTNEAEMSSAVPVTIGAAVAEPGQLPGAAVGGMTTMTVRVESVGPGGATVTYTEPDGQLRAINIRREEAQAFARTLRPGNIVRLTRAAALAITVEKLGE